MLCLSFNTQSFNRFLSYDIFHDPNIINIIKIILLFYNMCVVCVELRRNS